MIEGNESARWDDYNAAQAEIARLRVVIDSLEASLDQAHTAMENAVTAHVRLEQQLAEARAQIADMAKPVMHVFPKGRWT